MCSSKSRGDFSIKASDSSKQAYLHIVKVLLDYAIDTPVHLFLWNENVTSHRKLRQLIKKPVLSIRSLMCKNQNDGNKEKKLTEEQYKELLALVS